MAKKSQKNSKHVADLVNSSTLMSISLLAQVDKFAFLGVIDAAKPEHQARSELLECIPSVKREDITIADQEAVRLLQLARFRTEEMLEHAFSQIEFESHPEIDTFDRSADAMTRLIWLRVKAPRIFDQIETIYLTHHFHGHKKFLGFTVRDGDGRDFQWTPEVERKLHEGVGEILGLDDESKKSCEVIHFEMDDGDETAKRRLHYLVVYHPGKMKLLRQMKDRRRDLLLFTPALEATLVYDPAENKVHVLSDKQSTAKRLADRFAVIGFEKPLSKQPVDAVSYELAMFKQPVSLRDAKATGAVIQDAWISSLSVTLGHTRHSVTLSLANSDNVWGVSNHHFGEHNPLSSCRSVLEVKLSFVIRFDGEEDARALDITVGQRGSCNLHALPDPRMRRCGEDILTSLGVMKRVQPAKVGADLALFRAEMKLLDLAVDDVDGRLLTSLDLPAADLVSKGLLKRKAPGDYVTVPVEDEEGQPGFRRLKVNFNSTSTWALDDLTGERYDLSEGDLCRYTVDKSYLRERLDQLLKQQLIDVPLTVDEQEPYVLGNYRMGDQRLPVALVSRLWEPKHADKMDTALRQSNLGLTIVLTTTTGSSRRFLGPGIVVALDALAHEVNGQVCIEMARVEGEVRRRQAAAVVIPSTAVKILVDCSGSMAGDSIDAAKRALQAIVRQLGAGDRFSLSRFGSTVEHRSRGLWKATETTKLAAQRWVGALKADLGGTEMEAALSSTFSLAQTVSSDILLVTDGEISAIESTIESATEHFNDYVEAVHWAQEYAMANRQAMLDLVLDALARHLPPFTVTTEAVNCHHNYVAKEHHYGADVWVTRKGAIRAREGDLGIVPGSMGARSYIVRGKGNAESFCSSAHGAGRRMSRTAAEKHFTEADLEAQTAGVICRKDKGVLDEIPGAYKDIDQVMANQRDLTEILHTLKQVVCVKG